MPYLFPSLSLNEGFVKLPGLIYSDIDEAITFGLPVSITPQASQRYCDNLLSNEHMQQAFIQQYGKVFTDEGKIIHIMTFDER
jgi:ribose 5-phosphate isomerase